MCSFWMVTRDGALRPINILSSARKYSRKFLQTYESIIWLVYMILNGQYADNNDSFQNKASAEKCD